MTAVYGFENGEVAIKRPLIVFLLAIGLVVAAFFGYLLARPRVQAATVRFPIPAVDAGFAPFYLAEDGQAFRANHVDVKLAGGGPELNPVQTVADGIDAFGVVGGPELLIRARAQGKPLVAVAQIHKDGNFVVILTKKDSGLTKLANLEGKKVGFFYGHISTDVLRALFARTGVKVQEVNVGFDYSQFIAGKIAAEWAFRTTAGLILPAKGVEVNTISPADYGLVTQGHMLVTSEETIRRRPELVQAVVNAVLAGAKAAADDPSAAAKSATRRDPKLPPKVAAEQARIYGEAIRRNPRIGRIDPSDIVAARNELAAIGVPSNLDVSSAFTNQFVDRYYQTAAHP